MPTTQEPRLVPITVDGKVHRIAPGVTPFAELISVTGSHPDTKQFRLVSVPTVPELISGNDSYDIKGGEVLTTS